MFDARFEKQYFFFVVFIFFFSFFFVVNGAKETTTTTTTTDFLNLNAFNWSLCEDTNKTQYAIEIESVRLTPDPVRTGGIAEFVIVGTILNPSMIKSTSVIDVSITYEEVPLFEDVLSLCETAKGQRCPPNATQTSITMTYEAAVPELIPSGEYRAALIGRSSGSSTSANDDDGSAIKADMYCVRADLRVKGPFVVVDAVQTH